MRLQQLCTSSKRGRVGESGHKYNRMMEAADKGAPIETLLENHRAFLAYLERRVDDRALAEDILQRRNLRVRVAAGINIEARVRGSTPGDRSRRDPGEGLRGAEGVVGKQCSRPRVPRA